MSTTLLIGRIPAFIKRACIQMPETTSNELELSANDELTVTIENEDKVPYYSARVVRIPAFIKRACIQIGEGSIVTS
jgi:hypothetical protein